MVPLEKVRNTLLERRELLVTSINLASSNTSLSELLAQVDAALSRVSAGTYGTCEICKQPIEDDRLHADPLVRSCASHLAPLKACCTTLKVPTDRAQLEISPYFRRYRSLRFSAGFSFFGNSTSRIFIFAL